MQLKDILSQEEIEEYNDRWNSFNQKYTPEIPYNVHSGLPIIGKVFQFRDKPIFRAHIFKRKLKRAFDPYFVSNKGYLHQYFHTVHYFFPIEQIYHASMPRLIPNYNNFITIDRFDSKKPAEMNNRIDFDKTRPSIELIPSIKLRKNKFLARGSASFYDDRINKKLQTWYLEGVGVLRKYVENIQRIKQGDKNAVVDLIREIEGRALKQIPKMINSRKTLKTDYLIQQLKKGNIPEPELHDFFSFWDKP